MKKSSNDQKVAKQGSGNVRNSEIRSIHRPGEYMPVRNSRQGNHSRTSQAEDNKGGTMRAKNLELVNSLLHIRSRLEDYLRLVSTADPSQMLPPAPAEFAA